MVTPMKRARSTSSKKQPALKRQRTEFNSGAITAREIALARRVGHQSELKATFTSDALTVPASGLIYNLTDNMSTGVDAVDQYIGSNITPTSLSIKWAWSYGPSGVVPADGTNVVRTMIIQWLAAGQPSVNGILQQLPYTESPKLWTNREEFNVLYDRRWGLKSWATAADSYDIITGEIYIKGKRMMPIKFPSTGGNVPQKYGLYMLVVTDSTAVPNPYHKFVSQITFTDQ